MSHIDCSMSSLSVMDYSSLLNSYEKSLSNEQVHADVLIIGSGAGGAAAAFELSSVSGLNVVLVEAGSYVPVQRLTHDLGDMMNQLTWAKGNAGAQDGSLRVLQGRCVGGSTLLHMLSMTPISDRVLRRMVEDDGLSLMSPDTINPLVQTIKQVMNIKEIDRSLVNHNAEPWIRGCEELGYYWKLNERNSGSCIGSGRCHKGCPFGGKVSMDVSFVPRSINQGVRLYTETQIDKILMKDGRITGATATRRHPQTGEVLGTMGFKAPFVVLAAGALQTPALMLKSNLQSQFETVGSRVCVQPGINVLGLHPREIYGWRGVTNPIHIDEWIDEPGGAFFIEPGMLDASIIADYLPGAGEKHGKLMKQIKHLTAGQILYCDSGHANKVTLKNGKADLQFRLTQSDKKAIRFAMKKAAEILIQGGSKEVFIGQRTPLDLKYANDLTDIDRVSFEKGHFHWESVHIHGSCPMGHDPKKSVVDARGECHHVKNLYLADVSILPRAIRNNTTIPGATMGLLVGKMIKEVLAT